MIHPSSMPVAAEPGVYDTKKVYGDKNVSFGTKESTSRCGIKVEFKRNYLKDYKNIDERNLIKC